MLLRHFRPVWQVNLRIARLDHRHARANQRHCLLTTETRADTFNKPGILSFMHNRHLTLR